MTSHPPPQSPTELRRTVADNIRLGRLLADVSQKELERRTGIDEREVSRYEHGGRSPGPGRLIRIAEALDQTVGWFYDRHDNDQAWAQLIDASFAEDQL